MEIDVGIIQANVTPRPIVLTDDCSALEHPLSTVTRLLHEQLEISNRLETIADGLPHDIDKSTCAVVAERLPNLIFVCWKINRDVIFPTLVRGGANSGLSADTAKRLHDERLTDQGYLSEVSELLACLAHGGRIEEANAAGYLLRSYFEISRRAAAFELEYLVPAAHRHLTMDELSSLADLLVRHRTIVSPACLKTRAPTMHRWP